MSDSGWVDRIEKEPTCKHAMRPSELEGKELKNVATGSTWGCTCGQVFVLSGVTYGDYGSYAKWSTLDEWQKTLDKKARHEQRRLQRQRPRARVQHALTRVTLLVLAVVVALKAVL